MHEPVVRVSARVSVVHEAGSADREWRGGPSASVVFGDVGSGDSPAGSGVFSKNEGDAGGFSEREWYPAGGDRRVSAENEGTAEGEISAASENSSYWVA